MYSTQDYLRAAFEGHIDKVRGYLDAGGSINAPNSKGMSALMLTIWNGDNHELAALLVERGIDLSIRQESSGWRALTFAAVNNRVQILRMLLAAGDSLDDDTDRKALLFAIQYRSHATAEILLEHDADPNVRGDDGRTSLMRAARNSDSVAVELLLRHGADVNIADNDGMTALMHAATEANVENVQMLLDAGADPHATDAKGRTALAISSELKKSKVGKALRVATKA